MYTVKDPDYWSIGDVRFNTFPEGNGSGAVFPKSSTGDLTNRKETGKIVLANQQTSP
jgi:hypothetical protein